MRRHPRHKKDAPLILIRSHPVSEGALLRDVSLGGLAFETELAMKNGDTFEFALYVPTSGWVDGIGTVCWVKPNGESLFCGASIEVKAWNQQRRLKKWLKPTGKGLLKFFFPDRGRSP